jgi:hypothetical protein
VRSADGSASVGEAYLLLWELADETRRQLLWARIEYPRDQSRIDHLMASLERPLTKLLPYERPKRKPVAPPQVDLSKLTDEELCVLAKIL